MSSSSRLEGPSLPSLTRAPQNEVKFSNFAEFKKAYFMPFLVTFQKLAVDKGAAKDEKDMKEKGKKMAGATLKWIKAHFDELQFYSLESYMREGADVDEVRRRRATGGAVRGGRRRRASYGASARDGGAGPRPSVVTAHPSPAQRALPRPIAHSACLLAAAPAARPLCRSSRTRRSR